MTNSISSKWIPIYFSRHWPLILVLLILLIISIGYNLTTEIGRFPDEAAHLGFVLDVANHGFPDYINGKIFNTHKLNYLEHPALYYIIAGESFNILNSLNINSYKLLRLINYIFSAITIVFIYKSILLFKIKREIIFFSLLPVIFSPMFVMLSASISNDPLMIMGCAIFYYSLVMFHTQDTTDFRFINFMMLGCVITALTKATGSLSIICFLFFFSLFHFKKIIKTLKKSKAKHWLIIISSSLLVIIYYIGTYHFYGKVYPSPQVDPSVWYAKANPDAPRRDFIAQLYAFYEYNIFTLTQPYGHKKFLDIIYRKEFTLFSFGIFPFLFILAIFNQIKNKKNNLNLIVISAISFLLFLAIYFAKSWSINKLTGYPGAMQSRYFYGFIPFFILVYAFSFEAIKNKLIKLFISIIFLLNLLFSIYPAYIVFFDDHYGQEDHDINFNELTNGRVFTQSFIAISSDLKNVELNFGTYLRKNNGTLKLEVISSQKKVLSTSIINMSNIKDNSWNNFKFNEIKLIKGETYTLKLTSDSKSKDNAITWWAQSPFKELDIFKGTNMGPPDLIGDRYTDGIATVDGKPVPGVFSFRIYY